MHDKQVCARAAGVFFLGALTLSALGCGHRIQVGVPKTNRPAATQPSPVPNPKPAVSQPAPSEVPQPPIAEKPELQQPSPVEDRVGPPIRIGLTTSAKEIRVACAGEFYVLEKIPEASRRTVKGEIQIRVEQEVEETLASYRVQVASYGDRDSAEELRRRLADRFEAPIVVYENPDNQRYQVRVGEFETRADAQAFAAENLNSFSDAFVVRETVASGGGNLTLAIRGPDGLFITNSTGYLITPTTAGSFLRLDGKPYRGVFDLILNKAGRITVVNQLGTEEYLLGVVPAELSPTSYPESAALAAQAVAARTYALKNIGRFRAEGYDLTADVRTQVYAGVSGEKGNATEAVRNTFGIAIYYQDKLIDAMYMSTCGGRTEDFSNVFDAPAVPYLTSVFCTVEDSEDISFDMILRGGHDLDRVVFSDDAGVANRDLEFARVLGVSGNAPVSYSYLTASAGTDELITWVNHAIRLIKKNVNSDFGHRGSLDTRGKFLRFAAEAFFGESEISRTVSSSDIEYFIGNLKDGDAVPREVRGPLAYLLRMGLWRPFPDNTALPGEAVRRADALAMLTRWVEAGSPEILRKGVIVGLVDRGAGISVKWGNRTQNFALDSALPLFRRDRDRILPVDSLKIIGNEKLSFHVGRNGAIDFMEVELNPTGASSDRYSPVATWDVTIAAGTLAEKLRPLAGSIGEIRDLQPARLGNSGRAVQIRVTGTKGSVVLNGYKVRGALGLRDTLFSISRTQNPDGTTDKFTFHGRGWGHGVGLCQVGAFGMARAGRSYEEILKTYYTGVEIRKAY